MEPEHLWVTGRRGAGVTTTAANLGAALAGMGYPVTCARHHRSGVSFGSADGGGPGNLLSLDSPLTEGAGPALGGDLKVEIALFRPRYVVHDLAGEPAAVLPFLREEKQPGRLLIVTTADFKALATLNLFLGAASSQLPGQIGLGGVIANNISGAFAQAVVEDFTREAGTRQIVSIPHSLLLSVAAHSNQTIVASAPRSHLSCVYGKLARLVVQGIPAGTPSPLTPETFSAWQRRWIEITQELESGMVCDGAAI